MIPRRDSFSVPILAVEFVVVVVTVNVSAAVHVAASVFCKISGGLKKKDNR